MPKIPREEVLQIAKLAKLELSDAEIEDLRVQLGRILDHFRAIERLDTAKVAPMKHIHSDHNVFRADEVQPSLSQEDVLKNAPKQRDGLFEVPKVIDKS